MAIQNYYAIIGVPLEATDDELKTAFRSKAKELHPDKNPDVNTTAAFQELLGAFETLKDPVKRRDYDREWRVQYGPRSSWSREQTESKRPPPRADQRHSYNASSQSRRAEDNEKARALARERLAKKYKELQAHKKELDSREAEARTRLHECLERATRLRHEEPVLPEGPWYRLGKLKKTQRDAHEEKVHAWVTETNTARDAVATIQDELDEIATQQFKVEREISGTMAEISIEAIIDGVSAFTNNFFPWASQASSSAYGMASSVTPSTLATGALIGAAALAGTMALSYAFNRKRSTQD